MKTKLSVLSLAALAFASAATAQSDRKGTAGAEYLLVPLTAKTTSLGVGMTAGMQNISGIEMLMSNPAGLAVNAGTNVLFSRMNYVADIGVNYLGVAQNFGQNNVALSIQSWDFGEIESATEEQPLGAATYTATYTVAGLSFARQFTDRIAAGTTVKLLNERIDDSNASGLALDAGMTYTVGESGLRFGVSLKNFGPQMSYGGNGLVRLEQLSDQDGNSTANAVRLDGANYELPSLLNFGVSYQRSLGTSASVTAIGNFRSNSFSEDQYSAGLELGFRNIVYARGGYQFEQDMQDGSFFNGANFGAGLNLDVNGSMLGVDYAYRPVSYFGNGVQMVTATVTF